MIVATGLAHLSLSEGYILRVCGRTVTKLFSDPIRKSDRPQAGFPGSRAFSQLQPLAGGWAAVAGYSLYRSRDGVVGRSALPKLSGRNGIYFGDVGPDLVVVMSQCCFGWVDDPAEYQVLLVPVSAD